jgi:hypothetical protein
VIRFEREGEGEERFARWTGGDEWRKRRALDRLFAETETPETAEASKRVDIPLPDTQDPGVGPAHPDRVALWVKLAASTGPNELD